MARVKHGGNWHTRGAEAFGTRGVGLVPLHHVLPRSQYASDDRCVATEGRGWRVGRGERLRRRGCKLRIGSWRQVRDQRLISDFSPAARNRALHLPTLHRQRPHHVPIPPPKRHLPGHSRRQHVGTYSSLVPTSVQAWRLLYKRAEVPCLSRLLPRLINCLSRGHSHPQLCVWRAWRRTWLPKCVIIQTHTVALVVAQGMVHQARQPPHPVRVTAGACARAAGGAVPAIAVTTGPIPVTARGLTQCMNANAV